MQPRLFAGILATLACLASPDACAATKVRDGFASMLVTDGTSLIPRNPITRARGGEDVYYWIQWKDPMPRSTLRCVITGPDTKIDETENFAEAEGGGFSICGMDSEDADGGTYHFTQYLDGEMVGERSIVLEEEPFFKGGMRKRWKWMMGALALIIIAGYWIRRTMSGDKRSLKQVMGGEPQAERVAREAIAIGSRVGAGGQGASGRPMPPKDDDAGERAKLGRQFQTLIAQADKSKGLEIGRRYLSLLLKEGNPSEAVKVFKECIAADPAFRPAQAEEVLPIAKAARAAGDPKAAVAALRGFDKAHPGHGLIPEVFVFSAKLMAEDLNNAQMARKILQHVLERYPGHYIAQDAKRYLQSMPPPGA
jgi:hypothetical protein